MHRVTAANRGPWWFSSGAGRFDLDPPRGTCYLADDPLVALLEALGALASSPVVSPGTLAGRVVWSVTVPEQCDAGDLTARPARAFGVTAELATATPYDLPRRWAAAVARLGLGGLRYRARHDPAGGRCLALFGAAGERRRWRRGRSATLEAAGLVERLQQEAGIVVEDVPPRLDSLAEVRDGAAEPGSGFVR
jgi:hypothetical protein